VRVGRWTTLLPAHQSAAIHGAGSLAHSLIPPAPSQQTH
jgi:hypothetical protein